MGRGLSTTVEEICTRSSDGLQESEVAVCAMSPHDSHVPFDSRRGRAGVGLKRLQEGLSRCRHLRLSRVGLR